MRAGYSGAEVWQAARGSRSSWASALAGATPQAASRLGRVHGERLLPPLAQALLQPEAYSDVVREVRLVATHISYVFLTGWYAYKVKKPVYFGFLDYSTLARRRLFCHEEVRLGQRLAPDLYLGVYPIVERNGRIALVGDGQVIDYAVKMRRLPEDRLLDRMLREGTVVPSEIEALARQIAAFHATAEPGRPHEGGWRTVRTNVRENFIQTRPYVGRTIDPSRYRRTRAAMRHFLRNHRALLDRRMEQGRVVDGHGDLRAGNVCLLHEGPVVFDCIEFNRRFRVADVAAEVAFLAMDLDWYGRPDLARAFVDTYFLASSDPGLLPLLDFYKAYRAWVRGKVESLRLDQPDFSAQEKSSAAERATRYFALAERCALAAARPNLVIVAGVTGSGKTSLALALSEHLGSEVLSSDVVRKRLAGLEPDQPSQVALDEGIYSPEMTRRTYAELFTRADKALREGRSVILDATFQRAKERRRALAVADKYEARFLAVECWADQATIRQRLADRTLGLAQPSDGRWEIYLAHRARFEPLEELPPERRLWADTTGPIKDSLTDILGRLADLSEPPRDSSGRLAESQSAGVL